MPLILALLLLVGGGTTSALAQNSLPGDVLYPIKIHVNENVESLLAVTPLSNAEVEIKQASRRLQEAQTLASLGKLDQKADEEVRNSLSKETGALNAYLAQLEKDGATSTAYKLRGEWNNEMNDHYKSFIIISNTATSTISGANTGTSTSTSPVIQIIHFIKQEKEKNQNALDEQDRKDKNEIEQEHKKTENQTENEKYQKQSERENDESENDDNESEIDDDYEYGNVSTTQSTTTPTALKSFTLTQVATHNKETDCYTVVNGFVYDVTTYITRHPGGKQAIIGMCGVDASSAFTNQHGGQSRPASELASFKIGTLIK